MHRYCTPMSRGDWRRGEGSSIFGVKYSHGFPGEVAHWGLPPPLKAAQHRNLQAPEDVSHTDK